MQGWNSSRLSEDTLVINDLKSNMSLELTNHNVTKYWLLEGYDNDYGNIPDNIGWYGSEYVDDQSLSSLISKLIENPLISHIVIRTNTAGANNNAVAIAFKINYTIWEDPNVSIVTETLEVTNTKVYPNPIIDYLTINFETRNSDTKIKVYSTEGQLLIKDAQHREYGKNSVSIDMSSLPSGIYMLHIGNEDRKVVR